VCEKGELIVNVVMHFDVGSSLGEIELLKAVILDYSHGT
jgi:hypothetical protein